jgi:hypothetical protein
MVSENFDIEFQSRFDELMKARRASVGEIRVHSNGVKYQKQPDGSWKPVKGQNVQFSPKKDDDYFGRNYFRYAGKPKEAIEFLLKNEKGQVRKAYTKDGLGEIDIVYGNNKKGLCHIEKRHLKNQNDFESREDMAQKIADALKYGKVEKDKKDVLIIYNEIRLIISQTVVYDDEDNFRNKHWILTSYNQNIPIKDKLRKAVSEETALEKSRFYPSSETPTFNRNGTERSLTVISSKDLSLPKGTTNMNDMQQFVDEIIEKAKKGSPIGTEKTWGGKVYVKTELGWRPKRRDKSGKEEDKTSKNSSKVNDINSFASKASDEQLQAAIKDKDASPEVKQAAQEELNKRNKKNDKLEIGDITNTSEKKSEKITEEVLSQKLDKLKEDLTKKIDDKLNEINGFKKITQTYVKVDGNTIVLNMKGDDKYKAKKGDFYMESEPHEPLGEFKKRVKEAYENKLKEEKIEQKETTIPTKDKVEDKKKVNRSVAKIQVFTPNGQFLFGDTSKALESGKDIEFTKDKTTYRLITDDLENDVYTLRNQDTGKEVTWKGGLIRLKAQIEEVNKTEQSKPTLRFENEKELKEFIDKRNSLKGLNITNSLKEKLLKSFRKKDSQEIRKDYTEKIKELSQDIKDKNFEKILESYALASNDYKFIINEELINNDYLPVANGILYSEYDGREYRHFDEKIEASLFYKADVNKSNKVEKRALKYYSMIGYEAIRAFNIGEINNAGTGQISSIISSYIDKHPIEDNLVLNRRMEISSNINGLNQWIGAEIGDIVEEKSFASFSLSQLSQFGNDLQITLLAKKGDKISNINNDFEYEYLVQKNSKYKVIAKGTNSIVVELV